MRILHMAHIRWYNAEVQYALDLARQMRRMGHEVVFFGQRHSPGVRKAGNEGLPVVEDSGFNGKGWRAISAVPAAFRLRRLLRTHRFDAVEVHRSEGLPLIVWACRQHGVPVVRVRGDMRPVRADPLNRLLYSRLLSGVVASNRAVEAGIRSRLGSSVRVTTVHGGVDPLEFTPQGQAADVRQELGFPPGSFLVGILGRLSPVKGHGDFLDAARVVASDTEAARFVVLAKEPSEREDQLRERVRADPVLNGRVGFLGNRADLPAVLRAFDLGVVASTGSEANCRVGLEWMASGVPLAATTIGVLPDLVAEHDTGVLVPPGSPGVLGEYISRLGVDRDRARHMGELARQRVLDLFTLEQCVRGHENFLMSVADC